MLSTISCFALQISWVFRDTFNMINHCETAIRCSWVSASFSVCLPLTRSQKCQKSVNVLFGWSRLAVCEAQIRTCLFLIAVFNRSDSCFLLWFLYNSAINHLFVCLFMHSIILVLYHSDVILSLNVFVCLKQEDVSPWDTVSFRSCFLSVCGSVSSSLAHGLFL